MASCLEMVVEGIEKARAYTDSLLEDVTDDEWYAIPPGATTNVAWQGMHLAIAQYGLTMRWIRGPRESDGDLIAESAFKQYGRGSIPSSDRAANPSVEEIRATMARVHMQSLLELAELDDSMLDAPLEKTHPMFDTPLRALQFASMHEMSHAGQIGFLRRMFGKAALR